MDHHDDDNRWDYDCPQFVDFTAPIPFNDGADQMFESTILGEGPSTSTIHFTSNGATELEAMEEGQKNEAKEPEPSCEKPKEETEAKQMEQPADKSQTAPKQKPSNLVTSLEKWRNPNNKHAATGPERLIHSESPSSKKPRRNVEKTTSSSMLTRSKSMRVMPKSGSASSLNTLKSEPAGPTAGPRPTKSHTRTFSQGQSRSRSNSVDLGTGSKSKGNTSTTNKAPKMPSLLKRLGDGVASKQKSSEELEMERIKQLKKELQHKRQMAQESYKKAMSKAVPVAAHAKDLTVPQAFNFHTDKRLKTQGEKNEERSVGDFVKSLRSRTVVSPASSTAGPKKLTVPHPFHLTEKGIAGSSHTSGDAKFESMAEKVNAFHRKTPERFRARARSGEKIHVRGSRSVSPPSRLTQPRTPNLTARGRHRPTHFLSQEQLEAQEVEDMKQNQFKARPVNAKILNNSGIGVKKVAPKPPTEPEAFALSTGIQKKKESEKEQYEFHANPVNKKILEGPVGLKPVKPALPTVPMSPAFALKNRVRLPVEVPEEKADTSSVTRAKPVPHTGIPFQPQLPHQHTVPEPFTVEERSKSMLAQKEEKIRQVLEEEKRAREFRAQPLPNHDVDGLPEKVVKESTKPEPFSLETDIRGMHYVQEMAHKVGSIQTNIEGCLEHAPADKLTEEEEEQQKAMQFRAQPNRIIYKKPFLPASSTKPLTEVSDFELNSDRRAMQREEFEMRKKEREAELEGHRRQREQRQKEEEEVAIAKLRAEMVHRPNPIRRYNPVVVKPSEKPLTEAESPHFSDRLRAKVRL